MGDEQHGHRSGRAQLGEQFEDAGVTAELPLAGAARAASASAALAAGQTPPDRFISSHLVDRYGDLALEVWDLAVADPELARVIPGAGPYIMAEAAYAVRFEGALQLDDVLTRRTRISIEAADRGLAAAAPVAQLMALTLGWDAQREASEVSRYASRIDAERAAESAIDDREAARSRMVVSDPRVSASKR